MRVDGEKIMLTLAGSLGGRSGSFSGGRTRGRRGGRSRAAHGRGGGAARRAVAAAERGSAGSGERELLAEVGCTAAVLDLDRVVAGREVCWDRPCEGSARLASCSLV